MFTDWILTDRGKPARCCLTCLIFMARLQSHRPWKHSRGSVRQSGQHTLVFDDVSAASRITSAAVSCVTPYQPLIIHHQQIHISDRKLQLRLWVKKSAYSNIYSVPRKDVQLNSAEHSVISRAVKAICTEPLSEFASVNKNTLKK